MHSGQTEDIIHNKLIKHADESINILIELFRNKLLHITN